MYDNDFICRICHETRVNDIKISQVIRLGQRPKAETLLSAKGKPHGILVKFTDKSQRRDILRGSKNLQSCEDEEIAKISITKDLTFSQRQANKQ